MSLAPYVRAMGRGPSRGRSLTREEARDAMSAILAGDAAPEAVGALLMLMRYRSETVDEIAGLVEAMRQEAADWSGIPAGLDWPSYAAGRSRGLPWFLLAARLVAESGVSVVLHGWNSHQSEIADVRAALQSLGIVMAHTPADATAALAANRLAYVPLEAIDDRFLGLLRLRDLLGLRSAVNTALRALNPTGAAASVQGVFHPPYRALQRDAAVALGARRALVIKGGGGEFERHPAKALDLFGLAEDGPFDGVAPALLDDTRRLADPTAEPGEMASLWAGEHEDPFAAATVIGTAALAFWAAGLAPDLAEADRLADSAWRRRSRSLAA